MNLVLDEVGRIEVPGIEPFKISAEFVLYHNTAPMLLFVFTPSVVNTKESYLVYRTDIKPLEFWTNPNARPSYAIEDSLLQELMNCFFKTERMSCVINALRSFQPEIKKVVRDNLKSVNAAIKDHNSSLIDKCKSCSNSRTDIYPMERVALEYCGKYEILLETAIKEYGPYLECYES